MLELVSHCLGPGAALENMFVWVIIAYLQEYGLILSILVSIFRLKLP